MVDVVRIERLKRTSMVSIHNGIAYVAGMCGNKGETIQDQTRVALEKVDRWLKEAGTDRSRILRATVWISDQKHFDAMNEVWEQWVDPENQPSRAAGVVPPAAEGYDVEIIVTAAI
ncbi:RidA family protein [Brucella anthropi]|uniref:RidA family protein n=1 Tax=Brucella anthropi TaxID=529 RepID=UPI0007752403|nr:RidA family protein [Brucella anthropi]KXO75877.1 hypothetical protein AYJ56_10465 [Brucella anthropi]